MRHHLTLYQMLFVPPKALGLLRAARFQKQKSSLLSHPDKGGDVEMFKQVQQAQRVVESPEARAIYDGKKIEGADSPLHQQMT